MMTDAYGAQVSSYRGSNLPRLALLAGLAVLLLVAVGWAWTAGHRRVADEAAATVAEIVSWHSIYGLFAPTLDRETAAKALGEREAVPVPSEAQDWADASAAKIAELEQQVQALDRLLAGANADVTRLRSELLAQTAAARAAPAPDPAAAPAPPEPVAVPDPAPAAEPISVESVAALGSDEPAAAPPTPELAAEPEQLTITFKVNSSILPSGLEGRLRALAEQLAADHSYAVRLVGSVGNDDVAGKSAEDELRYNRWIAERRVERVADYLQRAAKGQDLKIAREFAADDPSRRVLVEVTPVAD
jgi:outer membrane protein OmpA-like peptidoglycan-associated protein